MVELPRILDAIESPANLKCLTNEELQLLAAEIRGQIIETASRTGGHVASSLGAVETILAVHSMIDSPKDRFIFDVGHQAYAHKLVTGRRDAFGTLRTLGGISGFPKPNESPHDVHPSGHASDSLSIALGLAKARELRGTSERIVALIGDASIAGGMAFEALNEIGQAQLPMVIILNDNEMSISRNVGALMKHFGRLRASNTYRAARDTLQETMEKGSNPAVSALLDLGRRAKDSAKQFFIPQVMIYEQLDIICSAPVDGHSIPALKEALAVAFAANAPVLLHVITKKGAGYGPAMENPERFHGVGPFNIATGEDAAAAAPANGAPAPAPKPMSYMNAFGEALCREARADERIVALTAAMKSGTGLSAFADEFPSRFIDGGIAEGHVVGMAAGLAYAGMKPVAAIYSTFLQRGFDQVVVDAALANADVVFAIDRAGLVGEDGPTHHGVFDMAYLRMVPNMRVLAPSDESELASALHTALALEGPVALRYPRGCGTGVGLPDKPETWEPGVSRELRTGGQVAILAFGRMVGNALEAAEGLSRQGIEARVVDMRWVKPLDVEAVRRAAACPLVVTVEEGSLAGGAGSAVLECLAGLQLARMPRVLTLGVPDEFVTQGKVAQLFEQLGLDAAGIERRILQAYRETA